MSAARLVSAGLAFAACAVFGAVRKAASAERTRSLERLTGEIGEFSSLLRMNRLPLIEIARTLSRGRSASPLWGQICASMEEGRSFSQAFEAANKPDVGDRALETLARLSEGLGSGDAESELARLNAAAERLEAALSEQRRSIENKGRLTSSLSVLMGLAAALLLI